MESVIVIIPRSYHAEFHLRMESLFGACDRTSNGFVIEDGESRVYVARDEFVRSEYESEDLALVEELVREPIFYAIGYSDIALCRRILALIADDDRLVVDNDHGVVARGSDFVRLIADRNGWDWRGDRPSRDPGWASARKTLILGTEYDGTLRGVLRDVLRELGAKGLAHDWGVGGSQELATIEVVVGADTVAVEAETFVGLSINGPVEVVERIQAMVAAAMQQTARVGEERGEEKE